YAAVPARSGHRKTLAPLSRGRGWGAPVVVLGSVDTGDQSFFDLIGSPTPAMRVTRVEQNPTRHKKNQDG
ncbi:MAG: hypothetical protein AB7G62_19410, partial [Magnetospirillum sp.]